MFIKSVYYGFEVQEGMESTVNSWEFYINAGKVGNSKIPHI